MIPFALLFQSILASAHYVWLDLDGTSAKLSFREKPGGIAASLDWLAADTALWVQSVQSGSKALSMEKAGSQLLGNVQSPPNSPVYLNGKAYFGVYKALNVSSPPLIVYHYNTQSVGGRDGWDFLSKVQRQDEGIFMEPDSDCKSVFVSVNFSALEGAGTQVRVFDALGNTLHSFVHPGGDLQVKVEIPPSTTVVYVLASSTVIQSSTFKGEGYKQVNHYATSSLRMIGCSKDGSAFQLQQSSSPKASSVARWLVEKLNYGFLSTIETVEGKARPFGNVISFANGHNSTLSTGRLFFYASNMDRSGQDLVKESMCSFTLTEAQLDGTCSQTDAQDAICAKVIFTGRMGDVDDITDREFALESLFAKNPPMKGWPTDHNWRVMELRPSSIFVLFHYGGAEDVPPNDYYKALPQAAPGHFQQIAVMPTVDIPRPHTEEHEKMARWMVHSLSWGVLSTISTNLKGAPFGHVVSISDADASGRIFVYMTKMSPSLRDVDTNARVSLSLSEAQVVSQFSGGSPCRGEIAEEPTCARLTLSGKLVKVSASDVGMARNGVFGRHRTMWTWPKDHKFDFYELKVEDIFFIDFYGGVKPMSTKQYFSASVQNGINEAWGDLYLPEELFRSSTREQSSSMLPWLLTVSLAIGVVVLLFMLYERRKRTEYVQIEIKDSEKEGAI